MDAARAKDQGPLLYLDLLGSSRKRGNIEVVYRILPDFCQPSVSRGPRYPNNWDLGPKLFDLNGFLVLRSTYSL